MKEDITYMTKLLKKKGLNKSVKNSLTACSDLYSQTLDDPSDAVLSYKSKNFYEVNQDISAASTAAASCEDGYKERGVASPLTQRNDKMVQLSAIGLNIVNLYARVQ
ncbi:unnamed protein product [Ilex paraguariensis]|uniref:Pectinesterase inhibitor domain-containing protein n=1 Tax=Ilex paraguariensis TaxID=185542 RepID=A0ABC8UB50_9AQUA